MTRDDTTRIELPVDGMTCGGCATNTERALRAVPGVRAVEIDRPGKRALIEIDATTPLSRLADAVRRAGYLPGPTRALPPPRTEPVAP